jgi:hypothetical protein
MSLCALCGLTVPDGAGVCAHHQNGDDDWASTNRIMCDFFHRQRIPSRLGARERDDDFWGDDAGVPVVAAPTPGVRA